MQSQNIELRLEDLLAMFGFNAFQKQISMHLKVSFCLTIFKNDRQIYFYSNNTYLIIIIF